MGKRRADIDDGSSSPSEHSPTREDQSVKLPKTTNHPLDDDESLDPEQDALVGETPLDDRFNEEQLRVLILKKDEYRTAGKKQRKEIAHKIGQTFAAEMLAAGVKMSETERAAIMENVKKWLAQRARSRREPFEWTVHWSGRGVYYRENKASVRNTQKAMYEAHTGKVASDEELDMGNIDDLPEAGDVPAGSNAKPFHFFQRALTAEWDSLTGKERDEYEEKAIIWRSLGPDEDERRRLAEGHLPRTIRSFAHSAYRQMGARLFILASWEDTQGRIITVPFDFNHELGSDGRSYKIEHRTYLESVGLLQHYSDFSQKIWPDKDTVVDRNVSPMDITFAITKEGHAILPDPTLSHPVLKPYRYLPNLVRKFMDAEYGLARGIPVNRKGGHHVPWLSLQSRLEEFVDPIHLPDGWTALKDPGQLGVPACRVLLNHWWNRQKKGLVPLQFHHWEASPPTFEPDGVTLKTPAKMVPSEDLPLEGVVSDATDEQPQEVKRKRVRRKKETKKTATPSVPTNRTPPERSPSKGTRSKSRSPSKATRLPVKARQGRSRSQKLPPDGESDRDSSDRERNSDSPSQVDHRGSPIDSTLAEATMHLSLDAPSEGQSPNLPTPNPKKGRVSKTVKENQVVVPVQEEAEDSEAEDEREEGRAKIGLTKPRAGKSVQWSLEDVDAEEEFVDEEEVPVEGNSKAKKTNSTTRGGVKTRGSARGRAARGRGSSGPEGRGHSTIPVDGIAKETGVPMGSSSKTTSTRAKLSAEDRQLLEVANSDRYRVDSPQRNRRVNKRYAGGA